MELLVIEGADGIARRAPSMGVTPLCRYQAGGRERLLMDTPIGLVSTPVAEGEPVAGEYAGFTYLDVLTWINPSLPRYEADDNNWLVVGPHSCIVARQHCPTCAMQRSHAADMLAWLLIERPELVEDPVVRELIDELPRWDEDDEY